LAVAQLGHVVAEAGPIEALRVRVDHGVGEQVLAGVVDAVLALGDPCVDVGHHRSVTPVGAPGLALADAVDRPGDVRRRQVVEQHAVGELAAEGEHARVERTEHHLGLLVAEAHPQAAALQGVEVAVEGHRVARPDLLQQRDVLPTAGEGPIAVVGAVPALGHHRRGDADADVDVAVGLQGLQRGGRHGHGHRCADLDGDHAGAEAERRRRRPGCSEGGEGLGAGGLGGPERPVAELLGLACRVDGELGPEGHDAGEGEPGVSHGRRT
jgi:hypothetical protein